jgi:chromosomal replication initiator protein
VFSSDKHPNFIPNLEDRIKSRFSQGMIVDIQALDQESKISILMAKAQQLNFNISREIVDYLAASIEGNVRELEGILNSIICQSQLKKRELDLMEIKNLLKNNAKPKKNVSIKDVVKTVANFYNIEENSIYDKTRKKEVVRPRQIIMYILREDFGVSFPSIGQKLGGRDHTTVIHSCDKVREDLKNDTQLTQHINELRAML